MHIGYTNNDFMFLLVNTKLGPFQFHVTGDANVSNKCLPTDIDVNRLCLHLGERQT